MNERKTYFSAVIERTTGMLNANPKIEKSGYYFKDIRTRNGDLIGAERLRLSMDRLRSLPLPVWDFQYAVTASTSGSK